MDRKIEIREVIGDYTEPSFGGSSKDFFPTRDPNVLRVVFRDLMHGRGEMREVAGTGRLREEFCYYFYRLLEQNGIRTHIAKKIGEITLEGDEPLLERGILVRRLDMILLELIARYVTRGNWVDPHKFPVFPAGVELEEPCVEFCLKWKAEVPNLDYEKLPGLWKIVHDILSRSPLSKILLPKSIERDDPRINEDVAIALNKHAEDPRFMGHLVGSREEWAELRRLTIRVNEILADFMASQGWTFEDGKFEVGIADGDKSQLFVGDEYTQDSCRVRDRNGGSLTKDLHRNNKGSGEIYDAYAQLTEAMQKYVTGR